MTREPMPDETDHIATALGDSYAALSQHQFGDGDAPQTTPTCTTPGCTNLPAIWLDGQGLCWDCYAAHDFGDDA